MNFSLKVSGEIQHVMERGKAIIIIILRKLLIWQIYTSFICIVNYISVKTRYRIITILQEKLPNNDNGGIKRAYFPKVLETESKRFVILLEVKGKIENIEKNVFFLSVDE